MNISLVGVDPGGYVGGDTIKGTVVINCISSCVTRSITVLLEGRENVRVEKTEGTADAVVANLLSIAVGAVPHAAPKRKKYKARHEILRSTFTLMGADFGKARGADRLQLSPGEHRFDFSFSLPAALPGSVSASDSYYALDVKYTLQVRADVPSTIVPSEWSDATLNREVLILGNHAAAPQLRPLLSPDPLVVEDSKGFAGAEGRLSAKVTLSRRCALLGEPAILDLDLKNDSGVALAAIRIKLRAHATVVADGHTAKDEISSVLLGVISPVSKVEKLRPLVVGARESAKAGLTLTIPTSATTSHRSPRLTTTHTIDVELVPQGWLHRTLTLSLPIGVFAAGGGLEEAAEDAAAACEAVTPSSGKVTDEDVESALVEVGGLPTSTTAKGHTALHLACLRGQADLCSALLAAGCEPTATTHAGFTPLHSAAFGGHAPTCLVILQGSCDGWEALKAATTAKGSTAAVLARADIQPDSPATIALASLIEQWAPTEEAAVDAADDDDESDDEYGGAPPPDVSAEGHTALGPAVGAGSAEAKAAGARRTAAEPVGELAAELEAAWAGPSTEPAPTATRLVALPRDNVITWQRDDESPICMVCAKPFGMLNRRHHCRFCGRLVCGTCGPKRSGVSDLQTSSAPAERMCGPCFDKAVI